MEILISAERIQERVGELAREIGRHFRGRPITIIGVLTGSLIFLADLVRREGGHGLGRPFARGGRRVLHGVGS